MKAYRAIFLLAAAYHVAFGLAAGCYPNAFFSWFGASPPTGPLPWKLTAAIVLLMGSLYAFAAIYPEKADLAVALGLAGKIVGPLFWLSGLMADQMSYRLFPLLLVGDLIWWFPLLSYLLRRTPWRPTAIAWLGAGLHLIACIGLLAVAPGTELGGDSISRLQFIESNVPAWTATWMFWALSSLSLLALFNAWSNWIGRFTGWWLLPLLACSIVMLGVASDLVGETTMAVLVPYTKQFDTVTRWYQMLSPFCANGIYCLAGLTLSTISWKAGLLRGEVGLLGFAIWILGLALSLATLLQHHLAMALTGAGVMVLYIPFSFLLGWRMRATNRTVDI